MQIKRHDRRKIIFLDIDGVLNSSDTMERAPEGNTGVDGRLLNELHFLVSQTNAEIVLSSDWRYGYDRENGDHGPDMRYLIERLSGYKCYISDVTVAVTERIKHPPENRGEEIRYWLKKNRIRRSDRWIVLDDHYITDVPGCQVSKHLIVTQSPGTEEFHGQKLPKKGLTHEMAERVAEMLNS